MLGLPHSLHQMRLRMFCTAQQAVGSLPASTFPLTQPYAKYTQELFPSVSYWLLRGSGRLSGEITSWNDPAHPAESAIGS